MNLPHQQTNKEQQQPPAARTQPVMIAGGWRPIVNDTRKGYCWIQTVSGMRIPGFSLNENDRGRWVGLPSKSYKKRDGTTVHEDIVEFKDAATEKRFKEQALAAIDVMLAELAGGAA
ncbi:MAG: hypothetical protein ACJ74Z_19245 [Bryobacteraceae bacterium]